MSQASGNEPDGAVGHVDDPSGNAALIHDLSGENKEREGKQNKDIGSGKKLAASKFMGRSGSITSVIAQMVVREKAIGIPTAISARNPKMSKIPINRLLYFFFGKSTWNMVFKIIMMAAMGIAA